MSQETLIYVFGSSNTDMVVKSEKLPAPGETVIGGEFLMNPGGKGANQAVATARLGGKVYFAGKTGNDLFGNEAVHQLQKENVLTEYMVKDSQLPSGVALINVDSRGENSISVAPGANASLSQRDVAPALAGIKEGDFVLTQLEIPMYVVNHVILESAARGARVILNPAPAQALSAEILSKLFLITPNESEAELLTGIKVTDLESARSAAGLLSEKGCQHVVITLGAKGAYLHSGEISKIVPSVSVTAVDTTAAGDCFNGALTVALAEGKDLPEAVAFACKAAAMSATRMGAQSSLPTRAEVDGTPN